MKKHSFLKQTSSILACKMARKTLRLLKRGGTNMPGEIAIKFDKKILEVVSSGMEVIIVTGTNGKTTTAHMIEYAMSTAGHDPLANKSGANLLAGISAEFICSADIFGKATKKYAVIECDEAALKHVAPLLSPKAIVVTNIFRDQLDRYGDVMNTLSEIVKGIEAAKNAICILNADDSLVSSIAKKVKNRVVYFGINKDLKPNDDVITDAKNCIFCGEEYKYTFKTFAHLGGFYCAKCGYKRHNPDILVTNIEQKSFTGSTITIDVHGKTATFDVNLPATYNVYNAIAALAGYMAMGLPAKEMISSLKTVESSFGRMENFELNGNNIQMILVKNPAGANQVLQYLQEIEEATIVIALNDNAADGFDISWIWDVNYEEEVSRWRKNNIIVMGTRAYDMQLRLKYAGIDEAKITYVETSELLIEKLKSENKPIFIMPNYTAMLWLREALSFATGKSNYWKR